MAYCPKCQQRFEEEGGFCPHDGTALITTEPPGAATTPGTPVMAISAKQGGITALDHVPARPVGDEYQRLIGTTFDGRYRIDKKLGEGGMGVVFLGRHTIIEKTVAIKVLKRKVARDHNVVKRFVQEAKAASRIGHPNIVDVTDFGTTPDGMTYSVMEFVEGVTLKAVIKAEAPLPPDRALPIVAQLGKALAAAHDKGIVHRDLKPENVFLINRDGRRDFVKVVDFGIAKVMPMEGAGDSPRLTRAGTVFGTPEYMAPEQAAGRSDTDRRVDIYALGTILYEMLVGKVPHKGESMVRTLAMQMLEPIVPPREAKPDLDITDQLEAVIMRALEKKRDDRYSDMKIFLAELEGVAGGVPLEQPVSPATGRVARPADVETLVPVLPASPPGASAKAAPADAVTEVPAASAAPTQRRRRARRTSKSDPAFLAEAPQPLLLSEDLASPTSAPGGRFSPGGTRDGLPRSRRWPLVLALLVVSAGVFAAVLLMTGKKDKPRRAAAAIPADAAVAARAPSDAGPRVVEIALDAGAPAPLPPGPGPRDHRPPVVKNTRPDAAVRSRMIEVQVITRPERATLYIGTSYAGTGDTRLRRPEGTRLTVTCRQQGYQPGQVEVVFKGTEEVFLCAMRRVKNCVKDLKNPFDDCPE